MSKSLVRHSTVIKKYFIPPQTFPCYNVFNRKFCIKADDSLNREYEDVKIPMPWGHISGVLWGPKDVQPILALHGWQDNANSWKPLANLLPANIPILAIDFPGHGKSSWHPPGMFYSHFDNLMSIKRIQQYFGWKNISFLGHSMGAITSFVYGALYPSEVNFQILVDNMKPLRPDTKDPMDNLSNEITKFISVDYRNMKNEEPPSYDFDTIIEKMYIGSNKSVNRDKCHILAERSVSKSNNDPQKYYFRRDSRLKHFLMLRPSQDDIDLMLNRISYPVLFFKFKSSPYFESKENYEKAIEMLKKSNDKFEVHDLPGRHHGHINNPEHLVPITEEFLKKYYKE